MITFIIILDGSGSDSGMLVNRSNVVDTLLHYLQLRVDLNYP
jgi:hypothetical protein